MTKTIATYSEEQQEKFLNTFNLEPLELYIEEVLKVRPHFTRRIIKNKQGVRLELVSQDIKEQCGPLAHIMSSIRIETFGSIHFSQIEDKQELFIPSIEFRYHQKDSGNNGLHAIQNIDYNLDTLTWQIREINEDTHKLEVVDLFIHNGKLCRA